jgi:hypothetical protein
MTRIRLREKSISESLTAEFEVRAGTRLQLLPCDTSPTLLYPPGVKIMRFAQTFGRTEVRDGEKLIRPERLDDACMHTLRGNAVRRCVH